MPPNGLKWPCELLRKEKNRSKDVHQHNHEACIAPKRIILGHIHSLPSCYYTMSLFVLSTAPFALCKRSFAFWMFISTHLRRFWWETSFATFSINSIWMAFLCICSVGEVMVLVTSLFRRWTDDWIGRGWYKGLRTIFSLKLLFLTFCKHFEFWRRMHNTKMTHSLTYPLSLSTRYYTVNLHLQLKILQAFKQKKRVKKAIWKLLS